MSISSAGADVSGGSHLLQVHGYSIARYCAPDGMSIKSNPFTVGRRRWELSVFPNGDLSAESDGFISVSLTFLGDAAATDPDAEASPVKLRAEFSFADETSKQGQEHVWTRQTVGLPGTGFGVGYPRFVQREALEASNHLGKDGDCFTVRCDLLVIDEIEPEEMIDDENGTRYRQPNVLRCVACKSRPATIVPKPEGLHICACRHCRQHANQLGSGPPSLATQCAGCHDYYLPGADGLASYRPYLYPVLFRPPPTTAQGGITRPPAASSIN